MPLTSSSRPGIRVRALLRWPASLLDGAGISWLLANGSATPSLDFDSLAEEASIVDPSDFKLAVYQESEEGYRKLGLNNLPAVANPFPRTSFGDAAYVVL